MRGRLSPEIEARLSLYLDGELPAPERLEFERRIATDPDLRDALEFHRGLTLEFHEEAPPLPRGYADRARARLEGAVPRPVAGPWWRGPIGVSVAALAALVIAVMAIAGRGSWLRPSAPARVASNSAPAPRDLDATGMKEQAKADEETIQALRSLGYLSSGRPAAPPGKPPEASPGKLPATQPGRTPAAAPGKTKLAKVRTAAAAPPLARSAGAGAAAGTAAGAAPGPVPFRVVPLPAGPDPGPDRLVIRSAESWASFVGVADRPAPVVSFEAEMLVVLRDDLGRDPPARLRVRAVTLSAAEIVVACRVEIRAAGGETGAGGGPGAAVPGQAIVLPASDLPVRVFVDQEPAND